jgi:hypothetical protein
MLGRHNTRWLDAYTRMALAGGWLIAHRAMSAYWRHRALDRITRCLTSTAHKECAQVSNLTPPHSPCATPSQKFGATSRACRAAVLHPNIAAAQLSLPPVLPWGDHIPQPVPRVPYHLKSPPMSMSPENTAARYHAAWSLVGGYFCNGFRRWKKVRTKAQRGKCS